MRKKRRHAGKGCLTVFLLLIVSFYALSQSSWVLRLFYPLPERELLFTHGQKNRVDPYLLAAIIRVESRYNPLAESDQGARGLMQLMPETATWAAEKMGMESFHPDMLFDPETNIAIGSWYLRSLNDEFQGRLPVILAAYNGGRGNVKEWLETKKWDGSLKTIDRIPFPETRVFVQRVLKGYRIYKRIYAGEKK